MYSVDFLSGLSLYFHWAELITLKKNAFMNSIAFLANSLFSQMYGKGWTFLRNISHLIQIRSVVCCLKTPILPFIYWPGTIHRPGRPSMIHVWIRMRPVSNFWPEPVSIIFFYRNRTGTGISLQKIYRIRYRNRYEEYFFTPL